MVHRDYFISQYIHDIFSINLKLEMGIKTVFPNFGIENGNKNHCSQLLGLRMGMKNSGPNISWERIY